MNKEELLKKLEEEKAGRIKAERQTSQLKEKLLNSEREKRLIINSIPDVILHINTLGEIQTVKTVSGSSLFEHLDKNKTQSFHTLFDEKLTRVFSNAVKKCLINGSFQFEFKQLKMERLYYYEGRFIKIDSGKVLAIFREVTEREENEKQLKEAKNKAIEASRSKSEFLANVSHEIRTPLNAILGFSQWLFENTSKKQHREYLNTILESARNLLNLLNDILDLSKIESGKMDIDIHPMNYQEVINDIKLVFQQKIEQKGLSFKITTDASVPDYFFMDELRFYQIVFNLVSNAIKFTKKGHIHISAYSTKTSNKNKVNLIISVEDTGIGIDKKQQEFIFDSFTQQSGQSNRNYEGTGLGLAIVNGLLKKLNGSINLKSKPGKGSVFTVTFYDVEIDHTDNTRIELPREGAAMKLAPCTIMIVDDISHNKLVLKQVINSDQVTFIEEKDGTNALAKLKTVKPDLIFMDIRMPGISGFDAVEAIKEDDELKHIPVIAFTASTLKDHSKQIHEMFDGFLQKPVFKKEVDAILKKFLKFSYVDIEKAEDNEKVQPPQLSAECEEVLPEIIKEIKSNFLKTWEQIKDNLVIYEIENFKNQLEEMAFQKSCTPVLQYCTELDTGLKSFDIELIERKLSEFPLLIEKLESF